jgi:hypothetical protein
MCDISKKLKASNIVAYKAVIEYEGEFYSCFSGYKISVGIVEKDWHIESSLIADCETIHTYSKNNLFYNKNMIGKVSGFISKRHAISLARDRNELYPYSGITYVVIAIELTGELMGGSAHGIAGDIIPYTSKTVAGTEILSIKKIM